MKRRVINKIARRYLNSGKKYTPYGVGHESYNGVIIKEIAIFPVRISREIRRLAECQGWDGCHWDDPLLLRIR